MGFKSFSRRTFCLLIILFFFRQSVSASGDVYELSYGTDLSLIGAGIALQAGSYFFCKYQDPLTADDLQSVSRDDVNRFDRSSTYNWDEKSDEWSNYTRSFLLFSPVLLLSFTEPRSDFLKIGLMYAESMAIQQGLTGIVKSAAGRKRPFVYNPLVPDNLKLGKGPVRSFYSGHTAMAFNSAVFFSVVFSDYYPDSILRYFVWGGLLLMASMTGYMRYRAGMHHPSDILVGAAMGSLTGYMVPAFHRVKEHKWSILPYTGPDSTGFVFTYRF